MSRKICVVTGTRAEYGLLRWVMHGIKEHADLSLQTIATGTHLSPEFGLTHQEIEADGFIIDNKVEMLLSSDTSSGITKSMGLAMIGFADALSQLNPDLIVVLGDRFEIFAAVAAAMVARIPVAHLHGGETSEGAIDEAIRHSISKMSHFHFVAAEEYRRRVIQLGEQPDRVYLVGGLGIDNISKLKLLTLSELEESLDLKLGARNLLVTFHPVTLEDNDKSVEQMEELFAALSRLDDTRLIFTMPNADMEGRKLSSMVNEFVLEKQNARVYTSLGQLRYLSLLKYVDGMVGNSSSGLIEMPTFRKGTINIGDRQSGRLKASSVIDCIPERNSISAAIDRLYTPSFSELLSSVSNPYGDGGASEKIVDCLSNVPLKGVLRKRFHNMYEA